MQTSEPLTIFLVDDDPLFITSLKDQIKKMFKSETVIQTFSTGEECLQNLDKHPDIIILDYFLNSTIPDAMNGLRVLKKIIQLKPETKVIMLSGQENMEIAVNLIKYGAYDYIIKNDNVFLRTKLIVNNAASGIQVSKELKKTKLMIRIVTGIIIAVIVVIIVIQIFYPALFLRGGR